MRFIPFLPIGFVFISLTVQSQKSHHQKDSTDVHQTILHLFDGMREGDSSKVHSVFSKKVGMYTLHTSKSGKQVLQEGNFHVFLNAVATAHEEIWDERIGQPKIQIDGNLAQVWVNYSFYLGKNFSHCGVNAFHLVKTPHAKWKIMHLIDTRRKEGCVLED